MVKLFVAGTRERFVDLVCGGSSVRDAAWAVGASNGSATRWWRQSVGMNVASPRSGGGLADRVSDDFRSSRFLSRAERAMIQLGHQKGLSFAEIGEAIGRHKSVIWREVKRNSGPDGVYYGSAADHRAHQRRHRPKPFKLVQNPGLCRRIEKWMDDGWSPKLIAHALAQDAGADQTGRVSHETIYQALYVQTRGSLRADLNQQLSLKRRARVSQGSDRKSSSPYLEAFTISQRPAEVEDRAVPGDWEGDLIVGPASRSAIGTLVERKTRFVILLHLPNGHSADQVADAMIREMRKLPRHLRRSMTWDRGTELAEYARIQTALKMNLYFCDPRSPWQRGTNENTNRLLRFWFEKGTDLSIHTAKDLQTVAAKLNNRPRPTLDYKTPAQALAELLNPAASTQVATTD
jgi:IS30 family transposase